MNSEKVKDKIRELIDCDKKQNELGGIIVVNRQFLIEVIVLINELESENERLLEQRNKTYDIWVRDTEKLRDRIAELKKENAEFNERLTVFDPISAFADNYAKGVKEAEKVVAWVLKQFAEMLKEKVNKDINTMYLMRIDGVGRLSSFIDQIDETLKEFIK